MKKLINTRFLLSIYLFVWIHAQASVSRDFGNILQFLKIFTLRFAADRGMAGTDFEKDFLQGYEGAFPGFSGGFHSLKTLNGV